MAPTDSRERLLDAAFEVFERNGLRRSTLSQVAQAAGVGRATLYRHFPGKDVLLAALVLREARALFAVLDEQLASVDDPVPLLERGLVASVRHLRTHPLLQRVLREEPEEILPALTVRAAPLVEAAVDFASPYIERAIKLGHIADVDPRMAAEWAVRILLSLVLTPSVTTDLDDPKELHAFVAWLTGPSPGPSEGGTA